MDGLNPQRRSVEAAVPLNVAMSLSRATSGLPRSGFVQTGILRNTLSVSARGRRQLTLTPGALRGPGVTNARWEVRDENYRVDDDVVDPERRRQQPDYAYPRGDLRWACQL